MTNDSSVRRRSGSRDKCSATATPISVDTVAATSVSSRLPASDGQNAGSANTRANARVPSASASTATATTGSAKNTASTTTAGTASSSSLETRMAADRGGGRLQLLGLGGGHPALVDLGLLGGRRAHVQRAYLRR